MNSNRFIRRIFCPALLLAAVISSAAHAAEQAAPSKTAQQAGAPYMRALQHAAAAYAQHDFDTALESLTVADQIQPDVPDTWNMRGAVYAEQHAFEKAGDAFEHAAKLEPGNFWPPYNLAQLLFMEKKYAEAADAFQKLLDTPNHKELIQFKLVLLDILQAKPDDAKAIVDSMKVPSDTAAYYFANAAVAFAHQDEKNGQYWVVTGIKVFGPNGTYQFYNALADLGYLKKTASIKGPSSLSLGSSAAAPAGSALLTGSTSLGDDKPLR